MSGQTTYEDTPAIGFKGMLAEPFSLRQIDSGLNATGDNLGLGRCMKPGASDGLYILCVPDDAVTGVVVFNSARENQSGDFVYLDEGQFPLLVKGRYWAVANGVLAVGAEIAFDPTTDKVGAVVGATTTLAFGKAISSSAADGDLIIVEVNF